MALQGNSCAIYFVKLIKNSIKFGFSFQMSKHFQKYNWMKEYIISPALVGCEISYNQGRSTPILRTQSHRFSKNELFLDRFRFTRLALSDIFV